MAQSSPSLQRTVLVLALLCLTTLLQSTALAGICETPHDQPNHPCLLCQAGTLPFLKPAMSVEMKPVVSLEWSCANPLVRPVLNLHLATDSPRAPPL